jgi:hypothetical protein
MKYGCVVCSGGCELTSFDDMKPKLEFCPLNKNDNADWELIEEEEL